MKVNSQKINILESALLAVVVSLPLWPSYLVVKIQGLPGINLTRICILLAISLWTLALLINQTYRIRFIDFLVKNRSVVLLLMVPFFGWKFITAGLAPSRMTAIFSALKDTIYCFGLFILSINIWRSPVQVERLVRVLLLVSVIVFSVTMLEVINQQNLFVNFVPDSFVSAAKLREGLVRDSTYRAWGTFAHPIALAGYCTTVLPLIAWYAVTHRGQHRWFGLGTCVLLIITIFFSTSRAGLAVLAFMAGGFFTTNYLPRWITKARFKERGVIIIISIMLLMFILPGLWLVGQKLASGRTANEAGSSSIRLLQIELGQPLIRSRPIVGYGPGEAAEVLGLSAKTVDNYYLTLALESGVPEVALFIFIYLYFLYFAWRLQKKVAKPYAGLVAAIFWLVAGNGLFLSVVSLEQTLPFVFLMFGLLVSLNSIATRANTAA